MAERQRFRIVAGGGIDLETGALTVPESSFAELVNFTPRADKITRRGGYRKAGVLVADEQETPLDQPGDCVLAVFPLKTEGAGIAIGFQAATRNVVVNRITGLGASPTYVGTWFTLDSRAEFPPRIHAAESHGKLFLAHDEISRLLRGKTIYYDRGTGGLHDLTAVLREGSQGDPNNDGSGETVYFRGVTTHLSYLIGWGFGHAEDEGAEIVRTSLPGEPTKFEMNAYWIAGQRGDPVLACIPLGDVVLVLKGAEKYTIFGTDFTNFGILSGEELFGVASSRLAVAVGGNAYVWSFSGPRVHTSGGPSVGVELPLGIDLPSEEELRNAFAAYDPRERAVLFVFGDTAYALSIVDPSRPRWTRYEYGHEMMAGGILYPAGHLPTGVEPGYAEMVSAIDTGPAGDDPVSGRNVRLEWHNKDALGVELVEIHLREYDADADDWLAWEKYGQVDGQFSTAVPPDPQPYILRNLKSGTKYQVALRLRVGNTYRQGYEPPTSPEDWPDTESRLEFTTSSITPSAPVVVWSREDSSTVKLTFEWGDADPTLPTRVVWSYDGLTWVELATAAPGENEADAVIDVPGTPEREKRVYFAVEHFSAVMAAGPQSHMVDEWTGPIQPVVTSLEWSESPVDEYTITWANLLPEAKTQINDNASGSMEPVPGSPFDPGVTSHTRGPISPEPDSELEIRLRYALPVPNSSLHDHSDWTVETITVPEDPDD